MLTALLLVAQTTAPEQPAGPPALFQFVPLIIILVGFWWVFIRSQKTQEKQRQTMVDALKKGDKIVNSGGIVGIVESIKKDDEEVHLRGGLRITKASIVRVVTADAGKEQKDSA